MNTITTNTEYDFDGRTRNRAPRAALQFQGYIENHLQVSKMPESYWALVLNEALTDDQDLDTQPARKKIRVDDDFSTVTLTDAGCSGLHQYSSPNYSTINGSINSHDLANTSFLVDPTPCHAEEYPQFSHHLSPIYVDSMISNYGGPSECLEHQAPALPSQMIDGFAMDCAQTDLGCLDLVNHVERPISIVDDDEDKDICEDFNESLVDRQEMGAQRPALVPEICFGMV